MLLATVASGHTDLADVLFLLAVLLFLIVAVLHLLARGIEPMLLALGLACLALAWLVL